MKKFLAVLFMLLFNASSVISAQSLLSNGDFENITDCPKQVGKIEMAKGWHKSAATPDLFYACGGDRNIVGVPKNYTGFKAAQSGDAYVGLSLFYTQNEIPAKENYLVEEKIYTELNSTIQIDSLYKLSFWYCISDSSNFNTDEFTITLTDYEPWSSYIESNSPQQTLVLKSQMSKNWGKTETCFIASGKWRFITLGYSRKVLTFDKYKKYLQTHLMRKKSSYGVGNCYYYFDNIYLKK